MTSAKADQANRHRVIQVVVALYSFIFFGVIAYGYFFLFLNLSVFFALLAAAIASSLAWFLAKFVGSSEGGIRGNVPLFILLLIISASGVYNSAMLYWEGDRILTEVIGDSQERFETLANRAQQARTDSGVVRHVDKISELKEALFSEIRNPLNCGQGPEAQRLIGDLQRELPGFQPLSNPGKRCERNEAVIDDYRTKIDALVARAPWNNAEYAAVIEGSRSAKSELSRLNAEIATGYHPGMLKEVRSLMEALDSKYRDLRHKLPSQVSADNVADGLDLSQIKNLGDATKLPALVLQRLNAVSTWVYLAMAFGFDWLMVHLFIEARRNRVRRSSAAATLPGAW